MPITAPAARPAPSLPTARATSWSPPPLPELIGRIDAALAKRRGP